MGFTQLPIQGVSGSSYPVVKRQELEDDHNSNRCRSQENVDLYIPHTSSWRSGLLVKRRDNFTFLLRNVAACIVVKLMVN
jgi:hypothetical protein